ncbi:fasciclin domain-containing protein [Patescibacteria group bacterium]|nr:fasciclin domain-containing protein [Patescibacteria group bacterium]
MQNIIDTAISNPQFSTLVTAIKAADLVETLSGAGPFTVFAPTNEAFKKIAPDTLTAVLADKDKLTNILTYHVVSGKVMSADVMKLTEAKTVQGTMLAIDATDGVTVNTAKVTSADIECTNGVIHVIDTVLMPA